MRERHARRVRWKVRRVPDGWLPVVLIGEEPLTLTLQSTKSLARDAARARAVTLRNAGI